MQQTIRAPWGTLAARGSNSIYQTCCACTSGMHGGWMWASKVCWKTHSDRGAADKTMREINRGTRSKECPCCKTISAFQITRSTSRRSFTSLVGARLDWVHSAEGRGALRLWSQHFITIQWSRSKIPYSAHSRRFQVSLNCCIETQAGLIPGSSKLEPGSWAG